MKTMKKILCLVSVLVLLVGIIPAAFAVQDVTVGDGEGSITVTNATVGKDYALFKLFDATYNEAGGVAYTFTKTEENAALFELLNAEGSPFALEQVLDSDTYNVTTEASGSEISNWIKSNLLVTDEESGVLIPNEILQPIAEATAEDNNLKFSGLPFGYYFLTSTLGTTITLTSNTPDQDVIDKNQGPSWDVDDEGSGKVITSDSNKDYVIRDEEGNIIVPGTDENSVNVGDTVSFLIGVNTTNYNGDKPITEYRIYDALAPGFEYQEDTVVVKIGDKVLTQANSMEEAAVGENYVITYGENNTFVIQIPWYDNSDPEAPFFASETAENVISVEYDAILLDVEEDDGGTVYAGDSNKNKARYDFLDTSDEPDEPNPDEPEPHHEVEEKETKTYTFALGLVKVDGKTKERLAGAEFTVHTEVVVVNENGEEETEVRYLIAQEQSPGEYLYTGYTLNAEEATVFGTDEEGQLVIRGLAEGSYVVTETKAPDGYNKLTAPITLEAMIESATEYTTTYTTYYDEEGNVLETEEGATTVVTREYPINVTECIVENNEGTTFPETGGIGTKLFYAIGGVLVLAAIVLLVVRKRMRNFE